MSETRQPVKIYLSPDERRTLDLAAKALGVHRGELIRTRALQEPQQPSSMPRGAQIYPTAVEAAARASCGIPRVQLEPIVAAVILSLHANAQAQPAA